jgi:hypothetical protein
LGTTSPQTQPQQQQQQQQRRRSHHARNLSQRSIDVLSNLEEYSQQVRASGWASE